MKKVYTIAFTGGPCAGKSTIIDYAATVLEKSKIKTIIIPETATEIINNRIHWRDSNIDREDFQEAVFSLQLGKEEVFRHLADKINYPTVVLLCDRGLLDGKAYIDQEGFRDIYARHGFHSEEELMSRYDAVFHLETSAKLGANSYETQSNRARSSSISEAVIFDDGVKKAWRGHPNVTLIPSMEDFEEKKELVITNLFSVITSENYNMEVK